MSLTQDQIIRLQKLTALKNTENIDISTIVDFFSLLKNIPSRTQGMPSRSGKGELLPRPDIVEEQRSMPDALLQCSSQKKAAHQIVLGGIMHGE